MSAEEIRGWVTLACTLLSLISGFTIFGLRLVLKPVNQALENNTKAFNRLDEVVTDISALVTKHDGEIREIKAIQRVHQCDRRAEN